MNIPTKPTTAEVEIHGNFVDGREIEAGNGAMLDVRNPATGDVIARIPNSTSDDIDRAMKSARKAFEGKEWGGMDIRARARLVNRLADAFEANLDKLYRLETLNNGRPVNETRAQLSRLPDFFRYFAGLALARRDSVIPVEGQYLNYTLRTPVGIVANCTPFNHPLMILCKSLAAVLASGCVTVVKPSEYTPLTTLKLAQIFTEAGLPPGVFNIVLGLGPSAGKMLAEHPDIDKLVLTGGTEAGRIAGSAAAKVFAHQTMELGGKTPVLGVRRLRHRARGELCRVRRLHRRGANLHLRLAPYRAGLDLRRVRRTAEGENRDHQDRRSLRSHNTAWPGDLSQTARSRADLFEIRP